MAGVAQRTELQGEAETVVVASAPLDDGMWMHAMFPSEAPDRGRETSSRARPGPRFLRKPVVELLQVIASDTIRRVFGESILPNGRAPAGSCPLPPPGGSQPPGRHRGHGTAVTG